MCVYQRVKRGRVILCGGFLRRELTLPPLRAGGMPVPPSDLLGGVSTKSLRQYGVHPLGGRVGCPCPQDPDSRNCLGDELAPLPPHPPALTLAG